MRSLGTRVFSVLLFLAMAKALSAQPIPIRVGGIAEARFGTTYGMDGASMANTRAKLLNTSNFGASGTVPRPVTISATAPNVGDVTTTLLSSVDIFFIGWFTDSSPRAFSASELAAFQSWVNAGGTMIVTCDDSNHDTVCASFGHPATNGSPSINPIVPTAAGSSSPIFNGPFGTVTAISMNGNQGAFTVTTGATVLAQDSTAGTPLPTVLFHQYGAGRVIFLGDVDLVSGAATNGAGITSQNDKFLGNLFAYAASCSGSGLCLGNSRFGITADWSTTTSSGHGTGVALTADTGYFWFFGSTNVEMVVKALDGCGITGHKWIFAGGLTNVNVTMTVTDFQTGAVKTYINPQGTAFQPIQDTGAFATCP